MEAYKGRHIGDFRLNVWYNGKYLKFTVHICVKSVKSEKETTVLHPSYTVDKQKERVPMQNVFIMLFFTVFRGN